MQWTKRNRFGLVWKKNLCKLNAKLITKEVKFEIIEIKHNIKEYPKTVKRNEEESYKIL